MAGERKEPKIGCGKRAASTGQLCRRPGCDGSIHPDPAPSAPDAKRTPKQRYVEASLSWQELGGFGIGAADLPHQDDLTENLAELPPLPDDTVDEIKNEPAAVAAAERMSELDDAVQRYADDGGDVSRLRAAMLAVESVASSHIEGEGTNLWHADVRAPIWHSGDWGTPADVVIPAEAANMAKETGLELQMLSVLRCAASTAYMLKAEPSTEAICDAHSFLCHEQEWVRPGRIRWIGHDVSISAGPQVVFRPPKGGPDIRDMLDELFDWVNHRMAQAAASSDRNGLYSEAIVLAGVAHLRYETIHPFADGNGRTGRSFAEALIASARPEISKSIPLGIADAFSFGEARQGYYDVLTQGRDGPEAIARWWVKHTETAINQMIRMLNTSSVFLGTSHKPS